MGQLTFGLFCAGLLATQASASILIFTDTMAGSNETPPTGSTATGAATVTVDTIANTLSVFETWTGLTGGAASAAHIHCCAPAGVAAPVALPFTTFPTTTSGSFSFTYDLTNASTYTTAFVTAEGGTAALAEAGLIANMLSGMTYTNIHNATFPSGEIRGQLALVSPEPGTIVFAGAGLLGLIATVRRRRG